MFIFNVIWPINNLLEIHTVHQDALNCLIFLPWLDSLQKRKYS